MVSKESNLLKYFSEVEIDDLIKIEDLYLKAYILVTLLFEEKKDKSGYPYVDHLIRVSESLEDACEKVAGLLHDILEDSDLTYENLIDIGFPEEILEIVLLVTKDNIDTSEWSEEEKLNLYKDKINRIISSGNIHAIRLKERDMTDNFYSWRLVKLPVEKQEWLHKKYKDNLLKLRRVLLNKGEE